MSKRSKQELEIIKSFVDRAYNKYGNLLLVNTEKSYDPRHTALGYCFKHKDEKSGNVIYKIDCSTLGIPRTDFRVLMHEYGHIYLGHLDGISEDMDAQICNVFNNNRADLIKSINASCGIDFADKLIERVIDDPEMNHAIHNIAMDFSVNSVVLSPEDIDEMEHDITSILPKTEEDLLQYMADHSDSAEDKAKYKDILDKMKKESKIKLMIPERYYLGPKTDAHGNPIPKVDDSGNPIFDQQGNPVFELEPFPDKLEYSEYLMLIIEHLDQFVKMLVSIQMGGNGDTSQVSQQDIQNALQNAQNQWDQRSDEYKQGYNDALNDYKNNQVGAKPNSPQNQQGQNQGQQGSQGQNQQGQSGNQSGQQGQEQGQGQGQSQSGQGGNSGQGSSGSQSSSGSGSSGSGSGQGDYDQGYNDALRDIANSGGSGGNGMQSLSDMMNQSGMSASGSGDGQGQGQGSGDGKDSGNSGNGNGGRKYQGERPPLTDQDAGADHRTDSRDEADRKREAGEMRNPGGFGCGSDGAPDTIRVVSKNLDEVDMALNEVLRNIKHKVVRMKQKKDLMKLYNRGVNRNVIVPSWTVKTTYDTDPTIVFLIDISGSMDTNLIDRILLTINNSLRKINRGLRYNIITWSTRLGEHIRDIDPKKGVPKISCGGGTRMAEGIKYFKDNYDENAILVLISDFEDYLEEWHNIEQTMSKYSMYGFNYGDSSWRDSDSIDWTYFKVRKFKNR